MSEQKIVMHKGQVTRMRKHDDKSWTYIVVTGELSGDHVAALSELDGEIDIVLSPPGEGAEVIKIDTKPSDRKRTLSQDQRWEIIRLARNLGKDENEFYIQYMNESIDRLKAKNWKLENGINE